jgi:hypothetical protein
VPAFWQLIGVFVPTNTLFQPTVKAGWSASTHPDTPSAPASPIRNNVRQLNLDIRDSSGCWTRHGLRAF